MSPEPYVRWQAFAVAVALTAAAALGTPVPALVCAAVGAAAARWLRARYLQDLLLARAGVPHKRERLDLIVAGDARAALAVGSTAAALIVVFGVEPPETGIAPVTLVLVAVVATAVHLSSLFDWYVILPRVTGQLGPRPCRPDSGELPRWPATWRETTRWWLVHRFAVAVILRFGISFAISASIGAYLSLPGTATIVAGAVFGAFFSAYMSAGPAVMMEMLHPTLVVGQTVRRHRVVREPRTLALGRRRIRLKLKRRTIGALREREYIYDVAFEGAQVVPAAAREAAIPRTRDGAVSYEKEPAKIDMRDVRACEPEPGAPAFAGCRRGCAGINWYCIDNPRCYMQK